MVDQIFVCIGSIIHRYSTKSRKKIPGLNTDEAIDTDITNVRCVSIDMVANVAMFFYILTARAAIKFFTDLHANERPFSSRTIKVGCH